MAFVNAAPGPPPGFPGSAIQPCVLPHGYLCITVQNRHANGTPMLPATDVRITVGDVVRDLTTDDQGQVTFVYQAANDFAQAQVRVVLRDASRGWLGTAPAVGGGAVPVEGRDDTTVTQVTVPVSGTFTLRVRLLTFRPGVAQPEAWARGYTSAAPALRRTSTPDGGAALTTTTSFTSTVGALPRVTLQDVVLPCVDVHVLSVPFNGFVPDRSKVGATVDAGVRQIVGTDDATAGEVTFRRLDGNGIRLHAARHGATVLVEFLFVFPRMMIVGEGTSYEYAVGLSERYGDALAPDGFRWVVVTQYDVVNPGAVSNHMTILDRSTGVKLYNQNQRQKLATAMTRNLVRRTTRFDATDAGHWQAVQALGPFDAIVFNNPHPGYGMHMCLVMGLTRWQQQGAARGIAEKNGRAVSVDSFGYGQALNRNQLAALLGPGNQPAGQHVVESLTRQRAFVRGNGQGRLDHRNARTQAIAFQWRGADTVPVQLTIDDVFVYADDGTALAQNYGAAEEFPDGTARLHYASMVDTIGLQEYLLRCYRYYARDALRSGGSLYVNGSAHWSGSLTRAFRFTAAGVGHDVAAMHNHAAWDGFETFVHYRTNFTSNDHHPSWYSRWDFRPGEPNISNARVFRWVKP